ncbi:MAG: response regulator [Patescibacteria group bacterium]|jgi:CheY-like chemotaxis protein
MNEQKTILVVEDERPLVEAIKIKLEKSGFAVTTARTVKQALQYLEEGVKIDVIWLDHYLLGQENGLDLVAKIKEEDSAWKAIPIFVVSNTATPDKVQSYLRLGVNKYYTKADFRLELIIKDIKDFLKQGE